MSGSFDVPVALETSDDTGDGGGDDDGVQGRPAAGAGSRAYQHRPNAVWDWSYGLAAT